VLDLGRIDVLAARDEHLLAPSSDPEEAVGVAPGEVARDQPAVPRERSGRRLFVAPVAGSDSGAAELKLADLAGGGLSSVLPHDSGGAEELGPPDRADPRPGVG